MEIVVLIIACMFIYAMGMLAATICNYPYNCPSSVAWWPIWVVTILPIRIVKGTFRFIGTVFKEIVREVKA